ncbi:tetratricopeptide repeat protein [Actinomadura decatromicini]|nr:tetratricopeptide repeat protein [Actinomadura decatromicini]
MVDDRTELPFRTAQALVLAVCSPNIRADLRSELAECTSRPPTSTGLKRLQGELLSIFAVLERPNAALDIRTQAYLVRRWIEEQRRSRTDTPDFRDDLSQLAQTVERVARRASSPGIDDPFWLSPGYSGSADFNMGRSHFAAAAPELPAAEGTENSESLVSALRSVLLPNLILEGGLTSARSVRPPSVPGWEAITWQPEELKRLVEPPLELLPAKLHGRDSLLRRLEKALVGPSGGAPVIRFLTGSAGVGKSSVALALARTARTRGLNVWWVHGAADLINPGMLAVAASLGIDRTELAAARAGRQSLPDLIWKHLEQAGDRWLLVFDNVDDRTMLDRLLSRDSSGGAWIRPSGRGMTLVTTRQQEITARNVETELIRPLDDHDAVQMLRSLDLGGGDVGATSRLTQYLYNIPLALKLTGRQLTSVFAGVSHADYLSTLLASPMSAEPTDGDEPLRPLICILRRWQGSDETVHLPRLLTILAHFASGIPLSPTVLDASALSELGVLNPTQAADHVRQALSVLSSLGLIDLKSVDVDHGQSDQPSILLHPMISAACRESLHHASVAEQKLVRTAAAATLRRALEAQFQAPVFDWRLWFMLAPHIGSLITNLPPESPPEAISSALSAARQAMEYLARTGAYQTAEELGRAAMRLGQELPKEDDVFLEAAAAFAGVLIFREKLGDAQLLLTTVLAARQRKAGLDDALTLDTLELLAAVLRGLGKPSEAEQCLRQVIEGRCRAGNKYSAATVRAMIGLAQVLREQSRLGETESTIRSAISMHSGSDDRSAAITVGPKIDLAMVLKDTGRFEEALELLHGVIATGTKLLGPTDSQTLAARSALGATLCSMGRFDEANEILQRTRQAGEKALGESHPTTLATITALGGALRAVGRFEEAEQALIRACKNSSRVLGQAHSETINLQIGLAAVKYDTGRLSDAEVSIRQLLRTHDATLDLAHPTRLALRHFLAVLLHRAGSLEEAESLYRTVLDRREWSLGPNHPSTLGVQANIGALLHGRGALNEAMQTLEQTKAGYLAIFTSEHPCLLAVKNNIAGVLVEMGRVGEARRVYEEVLLVQERTLGHSHPDTLITYGNLAAAFHAGGQDARAVALLRRVIREYDRRLPRAHPCLLLARYHLASIYEQKGSAAAALQKYRAVLNVQAECLGEGHPDTVATRLSISRLLERVGRGQESENEYRSALWQAMHQPLPPHGSRP